MGAKTGFKKAFSFKQQSLYTASSAPVAASQNVRYSSSSEDDTSSCSSTIDTEGVLIFPTVQRLTASSPPLAIFDGISGMDNEKKSDSFLSLRRRRTGPKASGLSSSAHAVLQTRAPYQSKMAQKNLPPALRTYRRRSDYAKHSSYSAWERRQSTSTSRREGTTFARSKGSGIVAAEERQMLMITESTDAHMDILRTGSSNSLNLPPEVSPANKFVPIGCEDDDDASFASADYDICQKSMSDEDEKHQPAAKVPAATAVVNPSLATGPTSVAPTKDQDVSTYDQSDSNQTNHIVSSHSIVGVKKLSNTCASDKQWDAIPTRRLDLTPSVASTDAASSRDKSSTSSYYECGEGPWQNQDCTRNCGDKYSIPSDRYECGTLDSVDNNDWFPNVTQEIMKMSSFFMSNCAATSSDTS